MQPSSWMLLDKASSADFQEGILVYAPGDHTPEEWHIVSGAMGECERAGYLQVKFMRRSNRLAVEITPSGKRALRRWRSFMADDVAQKFMEEWSNARKDG